MPRLEYDCKGIFSKIKDHLGPSIKKYHHLIPNLNCFVPFTHFELIRNCSLCSCDGCGCVTSLWFCRHGSAPPSRHKSKSEGGLRLKNLFVSRPERFEGPPALRSRLGPLKRGVSHPLSLPPTTFPLH